MLIASTGQLSFADFSAKLEVSSARSFRGIEQTNNNIAPSVNAKYANENGAYLGFVASRNDFRSFSASSREQAYFFGYGRELSRNVGMDISFLTYDYQQSASGQNRDWRELHLRFSFINQTALTIGIADDWLGKNEQTAQFEISRLYSLTPKLSVQGTAGTILTSGRINRNYSYAELGLIYGFSSTAYIRANLNGVSGNGKRAFGDRGNTDIHLSVGYLF